MWTCSDVSDFLWDVKGSIPFQTERAHSARVGSIVRDVVVVQVDKLL